MNEKYLQTELRAYIEICQHALEDYKISEIASQANLAYSTVHKLFNRKTKYPRFQTMLKIGMVAGLKLTYSRNKLKVKVI